MSIDQNYGFYLIELEVITDVILYVSNFLLQPGRFPWQMEY